MKMTYAGTIVTGIVVLLGIAIILPVYFQKRPISQSAVLLSFSIINDSNIPKWCNDLSSILREYDLKAAVFITGKVAERNPACVSSFSSKDIDIGSQTYNYVNLTSISDYSAALEEVRNGKEVLDKTGNLDSRLFKAPYGSTDQDIYSFLTRSGIVADFSYAQHYNKYENGTFIGYDLVSYDGASNSSDQINNIILSNNLPVLINFDNSTPVDQINTFISKLKSMGNSIYFVSASELTGLDLTARREM
jgi:peptidoglycan/xylan/chitin deacetylase (PgdA/CDA1 family)